MTCRPKVSGGWRKARDLDPTDYWGWECTCGQSCAGYDTEDAALVDAHDHVTTGS